MGTKVVATRRGYYGQLLEEGQLFELEDEKHFSERWMRKFDTKADKGVKAAPRRRARKTSKVIEQNPETLAEAGEQGEDWT